MDLTLHYNSAKNIGLDPLCPSRWFYVRTLGTVTSNSLACLNRHGFSIFASLPVILHAVKCQAISNDRYVSMNPITRYARLTIGSINATIIRYRTRLIRQPID